MNSLKKLAVIAALVLPMQFANSQVVINEVFAGGGNAGPPAAPFNQDYVELFNNGLAAVDLSGFVLQYITTGGTTSTIFTFASGTSLAAGQTILITGAGGATGAPVPNVTFVGNAVNFATAGGSIQIVNGATTIDLVGWGSAPSPRFEGLGPAPAMTNANSIQRTAGIDTNNNNLDFMALAPTPIPEPGTYMLLGIGALLCVQRFRRSRK